jgi:hypothetical protein
MEYLDSLSPELEGARPLFRRTKDDERHDADRNDTRTSRAQSVLCTQNIPLLA